MNWSRLLPLNRPFWCTLLVLAGLSSWLGHVRHVHLMPSRPLLLGGGYLLTASRVLAMGVRPALGLRLAAVTENLAAFLLAIAVTATLAYVATRSPFPPVDAPIAGFENRLGFRPLALISWVEAHYWAWWPLDVAYRSFNSQYLLILLVTPFTCWPNRGAELMQLSLTSLCAIYVVAFFFPTIGTVPGREVWAADWHALHDTAAPFLGETLQGIISLPSFHTVMGILLIRAVRGFRWVFWPSVVLNGLLISAAPVFGFHHLIDLAAGGLIAGGAVFAGRIVRSAAPVGKALLEEDEVDQAKQPEHSEEGGQVHAVPAPG